MNKISFPGLGIDEFELNEVAFTLFGRDVAWYGVIIAIGMIVAVGYMMWRTTQYKGINSDDIIDFALFVIIFGVIGARLYYVIFDPTPNYESFRDVIAIWEGGLAIYGGIIVGAATSIIICLIKKVHIPCFFDMLAPAVMIAQSIGRWGNFVNAEAYGSVTALPWRMCSSKFAYALNWAGLTDAAQYSQMLSGELGVHPTFLYESLWNLLGFILLNILYKRRKFDGQVVLGYLTWYGLGRGLIEGLRTDSLYIGIFRVSQLIGFISFAVALGLMIYLLITKKAPLYESASYKEGKEESTQPKEKGEPITEKIKKLFGLKNKEKNEESNNVKGDNENGDDN